MRLARTAVALAAFTSAALASSPRVARAEEVVIKLGTLAPAGSPWHNLLKEMGQKWKEASGGRVTLKVFAGGTVGDEGVMIRKMKVGGLQAAALTVVGMHEITPEPQALAAPFAIQSYDEAEYVLAKIGPKLEEALAAKGFVVLNWADVGFVRFFSSKAMTAPGQVKEHKLFCWDGDPSSAEAWRAMGFQPVILSSTDIVPSLQTGMIDTVATAPLYAFTARLFQKANHMVDLPWTFLVGATVVKKETWAQVPADVQPKLVAIAREYAKKIGGEVRRMGDDAVEQMKRQGLVIDKPTDLAGWTRAADEANKVVRSKVVPAATFDEVERLAKEYRSKKH